MAYQPGTNRLESIDSATGGFISYGYDGAGNTITAGARTYTYDQENRLSQVDEGGFVASYVYNGLCQRVIKTTADGSTWFFYDFNEKMIAETPAAGTFDQGKEYIYNGRALLSLVEVESQQIYGISTNYLGAVHQVVDAAGTVAWEGLYKPFGGTVVNPGSTVVNNWRLPGQYFDAETGLHYNYHRYYNATIGRYLTPDPIGLEGGINLYAYVQNNPINFIDPFGLTQEDIDVAVRIIKETQTDLRFPKNVDPSLKSDKYAGVYQMFGDKIKLNQNYLKELTDRKAAGLLDTLLHETLHANDSVLKQLLDTFRDHPDIYKEADLRTKEILDRYLKERKDGQCN